MYEQLTGKALPEGTVPTVIPLRLAVTDEEGQQDRVYASLLVMAPKDELEKLSLAYQKEIERREVERRKARPPRSTDHKSEPKMIEGLEARVRNLENTLSLIMEKLERMEGKLDKLEKAESDGL